MDEQEYRREEKARVERSVRRLLSSGVRFRRADGSSGLDGGCGLTSVLAPNRPAPWQDGARAPLPALPAEDDQAVGLPDIVRRMTQDW